MSAPLTRARRETLVAIAALTATLPTTHHDVARYRRKSLGATRGLIDALVAAGLVARQPRIARTIRLTAAGRSALCDG